MRNSDPINATSSLINEGLSLKNISSDLSTLHLSWKVPETNMLEYSALTDVHHPHCST